MPPKKDSKKEVVLKEDNSGIEKNEVKFRFEFEVKQTNVQNIMLMWEWFSPNSSVTERYDAQLIEGWTQKDPINDPSSLVFTREFDPIRVDEDFCKLITKKEFYIYFVNTDDSKIKQEIMLDYSSLLANLSENPTLSFGNNKLMVQEIDEFKMSIVADKCLLLPLFRHYLNPLQIEVVGAKDIPFSQDSKYETCYVQYQFFDGTITKTPSKLQKNSIKWSHKHVFLTGLLNQVEIVEKMTNNYLKMEVHDKDEQLDNRVKQELGIINVESKIKELEEKNNPPEDQKVDAKGKKVVAKKEQVAPPPKKEAPKKEAKKETKKKGGELNIEPIRDVPEGPPIEFHRNNYGVACFYLTDLLKKSVREVKLRTPIVPVKKYEDFESKNLDLNTTAKKTIPSVLANSNFFDCNSFLVISLNLAFPFGSFKMPQKTVELAPIQESQLGGKKIEKGKVVAPPAPQPNKKEVVKIEPADQKSEMKMDTCGIYERAIYYMPYKSLEFLKKLQDVFYAINMEAAMIEAGGLRAITTKKLSQEERARRDFDFIGGFEIIDDESRLFVLEGLSDGAMKRLEKELPRAEPNSETFKILKNCDVKFQERSYLDFNLDLKRIRLRDNLKSILIKPDLYLRTKESENICKTLNQINEIQKCWNIRNVAQFDLFPVAQDLVAMERKYSDSLNGEDIYGVAVETKRSKKGKKVTSFFDSSKSQESKTNATAIGNLSDANQSQMQRETLQTEGKMREESTSKSNVSLMSGDLKSKTRFIHTAKLAKRKGEEVEVRIKTSLPLVNREEVYIYGGQTNNWYEKQKREQRELIRNDKNYFYTYSEKYLGLSVDPFNEEDELKLSETLKKTKLTEKPVFHPVPLKTKQERDCHPNKPPISKIEEIEKYPYHLQREKEANILKNTRGEPLKEKVDFNSNIHAIPIFSSPQIYEAEQIKPVEKERIEKEQRQKEQQEQDSKLKGPKHLSLKQHIVEHPSQVDKLKNLRDGPALKKGLLLKNSRIKESTIHLDRQLKNLPSSIYQNDQYKEKSEFFIRLSHPEKCVSPFDFDCIQNPEIITKTMVYKPLKLDSMYK